MDRNQIHRLLQGGDRRSIGRADQVASIVLADRRLFSRLVEGLWSEDPLVRMRAADAAEKVARERPEWLSRHKKELLGLMHEAEDQELRWHLAAMIPRLALNARERKAVIGSLKRYLEDHSSIVKTFALQGLFDLAQQDDSLHPEAVEILQLALRNGTPAMKARCRKLLPKMAE